MTRLEELISKELVEWRTLGEVADVTLLAGREFTEHMRYSDTGTLIALRVLNVRGWLDLSQVKYIDGSNLEKLSRSKLRRNDLLITRVGSVGRVALVNCDDRYYMGPNLCRIRFTADVEPRYALHCFQTKAFQSLNFRHHVRKSTMKNLNAGGVRCFMIPLPPLAVQREIADVLDAFSERERELEGLLAAELERRRRQYEYYRDTLLSFADGGAEWLTLGEIATEFFRGSGIKRSEVTPEGTPCVRYGELYTTYGVCFDECVSHTVAPAKGGKYFGHGDVLFATTGESVAAIGKSSVYLGHERCLAGIDVAVMRHEQDPRYMGYVLSTAAAQRQKGHGLVENVPVIHTNVAALSSIVVPIPPIARQREIADVLDRFYTLSHGLGEGLPAELEARRKQYAYYRERLMSFPRPEGAGDGQ